MTRLAGFGGEFALMRVGVAVSTARKLQTRPARSSVRPRRVALRTRHLQVSSCEWKTCLGMVELPNYFPIVRRVTLLTFLAEVSLVRILVTRHTRG